MSLFNSNGLNYDPRSQSGPNISQQSLNELIAIRNERIQSDLNLTGIGQNGSEPQIFPGLTQASTAEEIRSTSQQMLLAIQDSVRNASNAHQSFLLNNTNPPALPTVTNLLGNGTSLFNNQLPVQNSFGLAPSAFNTSIFANSIPNTYSVGLAPYNGVPALPSRDYLSGRNSFISANGQTLQNLNSNLAQPTATSQKTTSSVFGPGFSFGTPQITSTPSFSASNNSVQLLNNRLNPPLVNSSSTLQPSVFNNNQAGTTNSAFSSNKPQIQATIFPGSTAPVQENITENNPHQPQNESASEEEEEEYEEEEILEGATTFAEDLQNLMANHQIAAPGNLFSNDTFTQNLVQFLKGFRIKAPRNKVLYRPHQEEPEPEIELNNQKGSVEKEEVSVQRLGIFNEGKEKEVSEKLPSTRGKGFRSVKNKKKKGMYRSCQIQEGSIRFDD